MAAVGSAAAVQAAAHVVCGSGGGSGGCGGTSGADCRRMPRGVLGHAAVAVIAPTALACGGGVCGCVSIACVCVWGGGVEITVPGHTQAHTRHTLGT